ncbi:acyl-CoA dehydrogenase [Tistlia consotensis]|uniref:Acyl-CoA dehydrogenase n=1 Tax=Tistlia consotensis USBA 355 TaxID=560819 RepID=A0A1Y6BXJ4_9PROT|nr:acyl-CoA dehydrogenase family protein [Tistlia consotensis]SMF30362.1 acyl-CoA dehydrogenase [Tistlia consotensis USBA 355]SNR90124.1 acyl-CoA dehydrogenase [Tistlia consotensis]
MGSEDAELEQLIDTVDRFVEQKLKPREEEVERTDRVPDDVVADMKALGLFGLTIPPEYGGLGLGCYEEARIGMVLGHTSPAFRSVFGTNVGIGAQGLVIDGTEEQKQKYLPGMASGEIVGSFCLTEPETGSDAGSLRTAAVRDGNGYRLNGTKRFITNAPRANVLTVMARTDPNEPGARGISAFIVDADTPGIRLGKPEKKMGQRGAHVCDVVFEDAFVPADAIIGGVEGQGFKTAMKVLDRGRIHISAVCIGVAERIIADAVGYAKERRQFGKAIAEFQLIQAMLADSDTECAAARALVLDAARRRDAGERITKLAAMCKYYASEMVGRVADRAVQIHGGSGYIADYAIERQYRDVRLFRLYEGTSQIQQLIIARELLKEHD